MTPSAKGFPVDVFAVLIAALALFLATYALSLPPTPCGGAGTTPAAGSHDRGRTI